MRTDLWLALDRVARRFRRQRLWAALAVCWLAWAVVGLALALILSRTGVGVTTPLVATFLGLSLVTGIACAFVALRSARDARWVARRIEARYPDLHTGLLAAVEQVWLAEGQPLGYLQSAVVRDALDHRRSHDWDETVPTWTLHGGGVAHALALACLTPPWGAVLPGRSLLPAN